MIFEKDIHEEIDSLKDLATGDGMVPEPASETSLVDVLCHRAGVVPERVAYRFLEDGEEEGENVTYAELHRRASALGAFLQKSGAAGERVLLLYPPGIEFVTAFMGCLYGGAVAVPAYPPRINRPDARLQAITEDARPRFALTTSALRERAGAVVESNPRLAGVRWVATEEIDPALSETWKPPEIHPRSLAFLQYTSGSTATPKGVEVRHGNLIHNEWMIRRAFGQTEDAVIVGWLPLYHDMGLIGNVLQPLCLGATCVLMAPVAFLQRPVRWLRAISRYRATTSGGPNFAYDLCARKITPEERQGLDLSSWEVAYNGAEPVRAETLERFAEVFAPHGFRREAFYPCYGLAEATLFVSGGTPGIVPRVRAVDAAALEQGLAAEAEPALSNAAAVRPLVSCGRPWLGQRIVVVDPETGRRREDGEVGEVWVAGPSVAGGYWNRPEETERTFHATLPEEPGETFLRTGDLGFLVDGELFLTGRAKDLIIVRGRNLYPQDVELTAERSHDGLRPGCGAAFSVDAGGEERLVVVQEVERDAEKRWAREPGALAAVADVVRRSVAAEHEVAVHAVVLVRAGSVPKTSSGKIRRRSCREDFLAGHLTPVGEWREGEGSATELAAPRTPTEERVERIWAEVLGRERVGVDEDLFALGGDSLRAAQLCARVNESFGVEMPLDALFAAPTVAGVAALLDAGEAPAAEAPRLERMEHGASLPLAFAQRRLWFLHQLDPENPVHNIAAAVRLRGALDVPALAAAFGEILRRHEALRTGFQGDGEALVQVIRPAAPLPLPVIDLALLSAAEREAVARRLGTDIARLPFDIERGPFLRSSLLRLDSEEHELVLALHHIASDGGSLAVLVRDLGALYGAFATGLPSPLPELPVQYADYAVWQRRRLEEGRLEAGLAFWRHRLAGELPVVELPADRPRPAVLSYRGAHLERLLPRTLTDRLATLAREIQATPFMALLAAFEALLHLWTGAGEMVLGTPIDGRTRVELEGLVGVFINNLVLRTSLEGDPGFRTLLERVRATAVEAFAWPEVPFERLVDELRPERDLSRTPLFQIMAVGQNAPLRGMELAGLELRPREIDLGTARFDLALSFAETDGGWLGTWKYATDLFDAPTMIRLAGQMERLLAAALADPERPVALLPVLSEAERHQVVTGWNDTRTEYHTGLSLHGLIAAQVERTPEAVALEYGGSQLSYADLWSRAGELAARLHALGIGADGADGANELVGICTERSLAMVVGLLGILRAGGAYVPVDPTYPTDRIAYMLADSGVTVLLTQEHLVPNLPPHGARVVLLEGQHAGAPEAVAAGEQGGEGLAYAIYTSGSTGRPKGAAVPHRGIVNRLLWMQQEYGLTADDRVLQKTPFSFDVSVWELFWPLITGARLVVAPPGAHQDAALLAGLIRDHGVTTLHFVPSMLQIFLEQEELAAACGSVRRVFASGEALPFDLAERFRERLPGVALHNLYGPTEASVDVTYHPWTGGSRRRPSFKTVPIGRPVANTSILLFDRHLQPVAPGIPGELLIGGVQLARGYVGRPELTAERFIPDPVSETPGARLYRTGDLARFRPDGEVEFLGRLDHQVKIRGVRIELGEIEAALALHPGVREAVVLARRDAGSQGQADAKLVAYLVTVGGAELNPGELRAHLRGSLPEAMIPSAFVILPALPLNPSGKVDRKALPAPDSERPELVRGRVAPRNELERRLAALWSEILGAGQIGVHDNFFELGGDSIQGAMLINRLQKELGRIVYVMALFDAPTVAQLADFLRATYPDEVVKLGGEATVAEGSRGLAVPVEEAMEELRAAVARRLGREPGGALPPYAGPKLPRALFLLSPFRSGSTLLRVMLAGHSGLFAPPELELLAFGTLGRRRDAYSGRNRFAAEGLLRAVMELRGCDAEGAREIVGGAEEQDLPVAELYARLDEWAGGRLLVDKTPSYVLDRATLARAEELFEGALYVHLVRHPRATVDSYVEARMDRVYVDFPFGPEEQAELLWLLGHRNALEHLATVPAERQHRLLFEDLVRDPLGAMEGMSRFLGLDFEPAMLDPYEGRRMTDGLHAGTRMMGDPKFHQHRGIDAAVADRWRESVGALTPESRELAARLGYELPAPPPVIEEAAPSFAVTPIPREAGIDLPLSFSQERLWFLSQLDPESPAYNMPAAIRLEGRLDASALAASFGGVRARHEVLRTVFPAVQGRPAQALLPAGDPQPLPVIDLTGLAAERRADEQLRLAVEEGRRPFDLARGPLLRTTLLRLGADEDTEHVLLVTMHHVVSDGWTIGILVRELGALYRAFIEGRPAALPALPVQYADYAWWQRRWLDGPAMEEHVGWWRQRLAPPLPVLEMPTDRPRPAVQTVHGARLSRTLAPVVVEEVRAWSQREGATFFLALLAGFSTLLRRYTGQDDLLIGVPIANRSRVEAESLIGVFLNMVAHRTDAAGDPPFRTLLARVRDAFVASIPHQEIPFERLVEALQPQRDMSRAPVFQIQLSLQNTPSQRLELPGLTLTQLEVHNRTTKFDFTVFLFDLPEGLRTTLEYNTDLFDEATIDRLLGHWQTLLAGVVADPSRTLSDLPMLAAAEREQLLAGWNDPDQTFEHAPALHRLLERQAELRPDSVAVVHELEELTYRRLNERANQLAHHLRRLGVGPETPVGLCVERSPDILVGILGILKAGGAYVPLDPSYPPERLSWILQDALTGSSATVLVTQARIAARFEVAFEGAFHTIRLDEDRALLAGESVDNLAIEVAPEHVAYVIYTSGSTGRPKGVPVPHGNAVRLFTATDPWFGFGPDDVWTLFHSFAFDFSVWEIWGALLYGGRVVVVPREVSLAPAAFLDLLASEGVTVLSQTPSAFRQVVQADEEEGGARLALRFVVFGGEALDLATLRPWIARRGDQRPALINMYGITETTVHVTWRRVRAADLERAGASPVGTAIPDLQVHLLGREMELLPVGIPGEIHVGGAGLARGYLNRPELTAERFVPDPLSGREGARLYRSGDLARRRPDGDLDYLGRIDGQVKVRGFRIELGEIEAALHRHAAVREAVVMARPDATGGRRLIAWVVPRGTQVPSPQELREHLLASLPEYMVPAAFVTLDQLPLTGHGKVDRRALPEPGEHRVEGAAPAAARTRTEIRLAEIWREVLRVEEVSADANFFELGGHSLLVAQLASRVRGVFGVDLPLRAIFEAPTLAVLAGRIDSMLPDGFGDGGEPEDAPIPRVPRGEPLPLSFGQERFWFLDRLTPGSPAYNIWAAVRLTGALDIPVFAAALGEIVRRHETLRTTFRQAGAHPRQVIGEPFAVAMPVLDLRGLPAEAREDEALCWLRAASQRPFDLERGPLLRALLVRVDSDDWRALFDLHHIIADGWSTDVLIREAGTLYAAFAEGSPSPLPELPVQYSDYAEWQRERFQGDALTGQMDYWRARLAGAPPLLDLPADRPRPAVQRDRGGDLRRSFAPALLQPLVALCRLEGATLFMGLLAGLKTLLHRYTGRTDILVGTPVAGRDRVEIEGLIGLFINSLVLRTSLDGEPTFREVLARTREATLGAFANQEPPFERLVQELSVERNLSHAPLFQVMLVLQNPAGGRLALPGLELAPIPLEGSSAKLDLLLNAQEDGGGLAMRWIYSADLFDERTIARLSGHLERLLTAAVADPEARIADLELLTPAEVRQIEGWNATAAALPAEPCLHELIEAQAEATPDRPAVTFKGADLEGAVLTYAQLDAAAAVLAERLTALGVGPDVPVGVFAERSLEMVVALLGILKAGGAYMPVDPDYPADRVAYMLEDSGVPVVLAQDHLLDRLPGHGARVLSLAGAAVPPTAPLRARRAGARPANLAYVIYTSGSTGRPKGTMNSHRGIVNRLLWMQEEYGPAADDRVLQKTPFSFDVSVWEIFWPLVTGARLVMARPGGHQDPAYLVETIVAEAITTLHFVPSMLQVFIEAPGVERCVSLRRVICSGEALPLDLARRFRQRLAARLHNLYGPTEAAVEVTYWACGDDGGRSSVPIGHPVANTQIWLLDRNLRTVPVGVPGELHIGGVQVARGYLDRPALTAEKFIPDPFGDLRSGPGSRLYKTGDLARWMPDGAVDFLGRIDNQVKVRGLRIELGEIEAALAAHPAVREAVVLARSGGMAVGDVNLVAYVTVREGVEVPALGELRGALSRHLPEYMLPAALVVLDAMPLSPNGKADRKVLAGIAPDTLATAGAERVAPRNGLERFLAGLFAQALPAGGAAGETGIHDNFFHLGGNSITGAILINRLQQELGVAVHVVTIFNHPTIAELAGFLAAEHPRVVEQMGGEMSGEVPAVEGWTAIPRVESAPGEPQGLSFAQERFWFLDRLDAGQAANIIPAAVRLSGTLDVSALAAALDGVVRRHGSLRTTFAERAGKPVQLVHPAAPTGLGQIWLRRIDLSALPAAVAETETGRLAAQESTRPFDLTTGPPFRASLLPLPGGDHALLLAMHHIISDGWSMGVFVREMGAFYLAATRREEAAPPELPIQYTDFARWQRESLRGAVLDGEVGYWRERLAGLPPLQLPVDHQETAEKELRAGGLDLTINAELTGKLRVLSQSHGVTLFMTLLSAFHALLGRHAGQDDLAVGSPVAGRNRAETEGLIGFFVNTLVLRGDLSGSPSFTELLGRERQATLEAFGHQDLPFALLVEALRPERRSGRYPFVEVLFSLQNHLIPTLELPGLTLGRLGAGGGEAGEGGEEAEVRTSFSLSLMLWENGDVLSGGFGFNTALFDAATASRWQDHFVHFLEAAVERPETRLDEIPLLGESERRQLLAWSGTDGVEVLLPSGQPAPIGVWGASRGASSTLPERVRRRADGSIERFQPPVEKPAAEAAERPVVADAVARERAELSGRKETLSASKRELLEKRLRGLAAAKAGGAAPARETKPAGGSPLIRLQAGNGRPPFFCVHAVGGTVFAYAELARLLGADQPVYGLQAPGLDGARNGEGASDADLSRMAAEYVAAIRKVQPRGPYFLGGWSMGGVVAFEMACQLRESGEEVALLALLDSVPSNGDGALAESGEDELLRFFLLDQARTQGRPAPDFETGLADLPPGERLERLMGRAREAGLLKADVRPEQVRRLLAVYKTNLLAFSGYRPRLYPGRVTLFRPDVIEPELRESPANGWEPFSSQAVDLQAVTGDHYTMLAPPHVQGLAQALAERLREPIEQRSATGQPEQ
jgi:amino acid adenylation domain-containing protein